MAINKDYYYDHTVKIKAPFLAASPIFKNAKQIMLPEKMVDTKTWLSDDDILMMIKLMQNDNSRQIGSLR